jgi:hypothetical protein
MTFDVRLLAFGNLLVYSFFLFNCGLDVEDPTPPSSPYWIQKSLQEEWPERGIDAHESGGIFLEWGLDSIEIVIAYNIYKAEHFAANDSVSDFKFLVRLEQESLSTMYFIDTHVDLRTKYYYKINAEDIAENVSDFSDESFYTLLPPISSVTSSPNGADAVLNDDRGLEWRYDYSIEMEDYYITVLSEDDQLLIRNPVIPDNYTGSYEYWQIPEEILLDSGARYKWRVDIGAKYINGVETSGSESNWALFTYLAN